MKTATLPQSVVIIGKLWFQKSFGNTYHSAQIIVDGVEVEGVKFEYGYGDQYLWTAFEKLESLGIITRTQPDGQVIEVPTLWARHNGVALTYTSVSVQRKNDL